MKPLHALPLLVALCMCSLPTRAHAQSAQPSSNGTHLSRTNWGVFTIGAAALSAGLIYLMVRNHCPPASDPHHEGCEQSRGEALSMITPLPFMTLTATGVSGYFWLRPAPAAPSLRVSRTGVGPGNWLWPSQGLK